MTRNSKITCDSSSTALNALSAFSRTCNSCVTAVKPEQPESHPAFRNYSQIPHIEAGKTESKKEFQVSIKINQTLSCNNWELNHQSPWRTKPEISAFIFCTTTCPWAQNAHFSRSCHLPFPVTQMTFSSLLHKDLSLLPLLQSGILPVSYKKAMKI